MAKGTNASTNATNNSAAGRLGRLQAIMAANKATSNNGGETQEDQAVKEVSELRMINPINPSKTIKEAYLSETLARKGVSVLDYFETTAGECKTIEEFQGKVAALRKQQANS